MKIKRYFAKDVKTALQMVRDDQGPDAVIMSNNKVDDGIEIITAIDYDEEIFFNTKSSIKPFIATTNDLDKSDNVTASHSSLKIDHHRDDDIRELKNQVKDIKEILEFQVSSLAWNNLNIKSPEHAIVIKKLVAMGFSEKLSCDVTSRIENSKDNKYIWRHALAEIVSQVPVYEKNIISSGGIIALIGPTGVGKTTTAAKIAAKYAQKYGKRKVGLITIDNYRVAAYDQLKVYGKIIDIPVRIAESNSELNSILNDYYDKKMIIIDTAGLGQYDKGNADQAAILDQERFNVRKSLVISAATQYKAINDIIRSFSCYSPSDCIITKLDESPTQGYIIDSLIMKNLPISFITDGQEVPNDLHPVVAHNLISRCVAATKQDYDAPSDLLMAINYGEVTTNACV